MDWASYDGIAEEYASRAEQVYFAAPARDLVSLLPVGNGARLLDVGTGTGAVAKAAERSGWRVVGCDPSISMLLVAGRRLACALPHLPFRKGTFDAVTLGFVLSHVRDVVEALREVKRVGGRVAASSWLAGPGASAPSRVWTRVADRFLPASMVSNALAGALPSEDRLATGEAWLHALREAGFGNCEVHQRTYTVQMTADEFLDSRLVAFPARYMLTQLSSDAWRRFLAESRAAVKREFGEPLRFETTVNLALGR